jgi:hypothetical protein
MKIISNIHLVLIVPIGGFCRTDTECGGEYTALCKNGRCRRPGVGDLCKTKPGVLPDNNCANGTTCNPLTKKCK